MNINDIINNMRYLGILIETKLLKMLLILSSLVSINTMNMFIN